MASKCVKCGYESEANSPKLGLLLCSVCLAFSPSEPEELDKYVEEKLDGTLLDTFRKSSFLAGKRQKEGMAAKASQGNLMSRAPFGYKIENKKLVPAQNSREIEEIFEEFLNSDSNLTNLANKHSLSVNGLKKVLTNFTYLGKIKFNGQIHNGNHQPLVSSTLFNHVQNKIERLKIKNPN